MDFLALDFETATTAADSPCELGIAIVRGGAVREVRNWLIKPQQWPYFNPWNVAVHGIRPADVERAPRWHEVWPEVQELLLGATVVAHNAAFDINVLKATLASQRIAHPSFRYFCSVSMARRVWPGHNSYGLSAMCAFHGITLQHHRAGNDAAATAELVLRALLDGDTVDTFARRSRINFGALYPGGHRTPGGKVSTVAL